METMASRGASGGDEGQVLRGIVIAISPVELALCVGMAAWVMLGTSDPLGNNIALGAARLIGLTLAVLVLPRLLLAWRATSSCP